ncbi:MAG: alkaline phosphatase family protein [Rhodospirillaceae bacterium]|nr:alkaline phosphatase family protein [Rhodospirillaceae bacterium]
MHRPVIAILLDAWEPAWIERWFAEGYLPTLARLHAESARVPLHGVHPFTGELPTHALLTSTYPAKAGYWGAFDYDRAHCAPLYARAYDYGEIRSFFDYTPGLAVCQFDLPKAGLARVAAGIQVLNWGAHGSLNPSISNPPEIFGELVRKYGLHPALEQDHLEPWQTAELDLLYEKLHDGVRLRSAVHRDLLSREAWDLFLACYSEVHSAAHCFMHLEDLDYTLIGDGPTGHRMLALARAVDRSIADLLAAAPPDASVAVFSIHGMVRNGWDIDTMYILPELLHRIAFPARVRHTTGALPPPSAGAWYWADQVWDATFDIGRPKPAMSEGINWVPAAWYAPDWPQMDVFALPGLDEGMVRLNVQGRDPFGRVAPADYETRLADVARAIAGLRDARSGRPLVNRFFRTRRDPLADGPDLPPADLIVEWKEEPCDVADSPLVGRIGPVPLRRTGGHSRNGFAWFRDPRMPAGDRAAATPYDVGPTLLEMTGAASPAHFDGRSLLRATSVSPDRPPDRSMFAVFDPDAVPHRAGGLR